MDRHAWELGCDRIGIYAYLDDIVMVVPPELAWTAIQEATQLLHTHCGLDINTTKTAIWSPSGCCPDQRRLKQWRAEGFVLLGTPMDKTGSEACIHDIDEEYRS